MPGPPPKPAAVRLRDGNPAKRPIVDEARVGVPVVVADEFAPPVEMPAAARAVWDEVVPELVEIGLVRSIDATVLESMCRAVARAREAEAIIDAEGFVVVGHRGQTVHPAFRVARDSWAAALKIAGEYGMTAVGRLRVGAAVLKQRSLAEDLKAALDGEDDEIIEGDAVEVAEVKAPKPKPKARAKKKA